MQGQIRKGLGRGENIGFILGYSVGFAFGQGGGGDKI